MCFSFQSGTREAKAGKGDQAVPETEEVSKPTGLLTMKKSADPINPEKGLGLDNAIIHSINCCGKKFPLQAVVSSQLVPSGHSSYRCCIYTFFSLRIGRDAAKTVQQYSSHWRWIHV